MEIPKQYTLVNALLRVFILNLFHVLWFSGSHTSHIYSRKWIPMKRTMTPLRCKIYLLAAAYINHPPNYTHNITDTRAKQHILKMAKIYSRMGVSLPRSANPLSTFSCVAISAKHSHVINYKLASVSLATCMYTCIKSTACHLNKNYMASLGTYFRIGKKQITYFYVEGLQEDGH